MDLFVKNTDEFVVEVYAWEQENEVKASHDKSRIPKEVSDVETIVFTFRKPNYSDTTAFMRQTQTGQSGTTDLVGFQDLVLRTLLKDWTLSESGKKVTITPQKISRLAPAVAVAATAGCLEKIF